MNPLNDIQEKATQLIKKAEEEPEEVHSQLQKLLKPAIKIGNKFGNPEPEKQLYRELKEIDPEDTESLQKSIRDWKEKRDGND